MHKLEHTIKQRVEAIITSFQTKDASVLQNRLKELSSIQFPKQEDQITKLHQKVQGKMPIQKIEQYQLIKDKIKNNNNILEIIARGKVILEKFNGYFELSQYQLEKGHSILVQSLEALKKFQELSSLGYPDFNLLRQQLYLQLLAKIQKQIQDQSNKHDKFKECLDHLDLPLKKGESRKDNPEQKLKVYLLSCLHRECFCSTVQRQLCNLIEKEDNFGSKLLQIFWQPSVKTILYLFTSGSELHNLQEPAWMFEYLQLTLVSNYKYFHDLLIGKHLKEEVNYSLSHYFLEGSLQFLFFKVIDKRLQEDIKLLNPFLSFNFLDELSGLEIKLQSAFGIRFNMLERILLRYDGLLQKAFEYQNQRFQIKIFEDFININYSQVNLKNLEAFNLMLAFLNMLERLHAKFMPIINPKLKKQINKFYRLRIMALVANLKTSFDRIYDHSRLPKLDILVSFKRTQKELRNSLLDMTVADSELEQNLQKEYYCYLQKFYEAAALEALTPVHKKLHISLGDILDKFATVQESNHDQMFKGFAIIQKQWVIKMDLILKFSNYTDNKVRSIFFSYLQALSFSSVGLNLFLKIFEPFLQMIFQQDRHRTLISLITETRNRYLEYIEAHPQALAFLNQDQRNKLTKFKQSSLIDSN